MSVKTGIAWTDHTFNIAWGCLRVSEGCTNCYAETFAKRYGFKVWGPSKTTPRRTFGETHWAGPLEWNDSAASAKVRRRVFCSSMCDVFEDHPTIDAERQKLWPLIRATPHLDWQLLTKRPENIEANLPSDWGSGYDNVWLGTSIETQDYIERGYVLAKIPARVRFLSCEPLLGPLDISQIPGLHWAIVGAESGGSRRPFDIEWLRAISEQCVERGFAYFSKQDGAFKPGHRGRIPDDLWRHEFPRVAA